MAQYLDMYGFQTSSTVQQFLYTDSQRLFANPALPSYFQEELQKLTNIGQAFSVKTSRATPRNNAAKSICQQSKHLLPSTVDNNFQSRYSHVRDEPPSPSSPTADTASLAVCQQSVTDSRVWCEDGRTDMREIVHLQAGQCGNQIGSKVTSFACLSVFPRCSSVTI